MPFPHPFSRLESWSRVLGTNPRHVSSVRNTSSLSVRWPQDGRAGAGQWAVPIPVTGWAGPPPGQNTGRSGGSPTPVDAYAPAQRAAPPSTRPVREPFPSAPPPRPASPSGPRAAPFETLAGVHGRGRSDVFAAGQALHEAEQTAATVAAAMHEQGKQWVSRSDAAALVQDAAGAAAGDVSAGLAGGDAQQQYSADGVQQGGEDGVTSRVAAAEARAAALRTMAVSADRRLKAAAAGGIRPVVAAMTAHAGNADVAEAGCVALRNLSSKMEARDHILACEGIMAAVAAIHSHATRPGVLETACDAIAGLSAVLEPGEAGPEPIGALITTLLSMPGNPGTVNHACRAIAAVATRDDDARQAACTSGAIEAVSSSLHTHGADITVVESAASALVALLSYDATSNTAPGAAEPTHGSNGVIPAHAARAVAAAASAGAPAACFRALNTHTTSPAVLERSCAAIRLLAAPPGNRAACAGAGGIASVVAALRAHPGHAGLQASASGALRVLAWDSGTKSAAVEAGAVEAVVTALRAHPQHAAVAESACGALKSLAAHASARARGGRAADAAVAALRAHSASPGVCMEACGALANLCAGIPDNGARATQAGAAAAIVSALNRHGDSGDVAEAGAAAVWALAGCGDSAACISCVEQGALPALVSAMRAHQTSLPLQVVACAAMTHFAQCLTTGAMEVASAGGVDALLAALRLHGNSATLQESGFDALFTMCDKGGLEVSRRALQAGALEACKAAITTRFPNHPGVQRAAKAVLQELTRARVTLATADASLASSDPALAAVNAQVAGLGVGAARSSCHDAFGASQYLAAMQAKLVEWLGAGGGNSDWLDLVELALTTQWHEWEAGLSTTNVASPDAETN